jgi:putative oxidoreductase
MSDERMTIAAPRRFLLLAARLILGGVFVLAGALKLRDPVTFTNDIANYQLWPALAPLLAAVLPALEVVVGVALLALGARWRRSAALCAAGMMVVFTAAASSALARGLDVSCGCFGSASGSGTIGWLTIARDVGLIAAAAVVVTLERESR